MRIAYLDESGTPVGLANSADVVCEISARDEAATASGLNAGDKVSAAEYRMTLPNERVVAEEIERARQRLEDRSGRNLRR